MSWWRSSVCLSVVAFGLASSAGGLAALAQDAAPLAFEVVSVKQSAGPPGSSRSQVVPGRFTFTDLPVMALITRAYGVPRWTIKNAPEWVGTERFTIQATFPPSSTATQVNEMLRTLLEQRFRLSVQRETRDMDTDALILASREKGVGPGLHPVNVDCETNELRDGSGPGLFASMTARPACRSVLVTVAFSPDNPRAVRRASASRFAAITMADLADMLSGSWERPVLDRTELTGQFDVELEYAPPTAPAAATDARVVATTPDEGPTLPVALAEQLGLKLRRERNSIEILTVRSVARPRSEEN